MVANYDGSTVSVIDVSLDEYGNDSTTFGTTFTIPVGNNPASVTALADGSRAYTANQSDGTVSIVNLTSHTFEKTLPVNGHPRTVVSTQNSLYGKVYAASPDSPFLTIIRTDLDLVDTTVLVEGNIVDVRVTTQTGCTREYFYYEPGAGLWTAVQYSTPSAGPAISRGLHPAGLSGIAVAGPGTFRADLWADPRRSNFKQAVPPKGTARFACADEWGRGRKPDQPCKTPCDRHYRRSHGRA